MNVRKIGPVEIDQNGKGEGAFVFGRRQALQLLGRVGVLCGVAGGVACHSKDAAAHENISKVLAARTLADTDFRLLSRLTEIIIPKTDTAGSIEAGVPEFIDAALGMSQSKTLPGSAGDYAWDNLNLLFAEGLKWIQARATSAHGKDFLELDQHQQFVLLESAYAAVESDDSISRSAQFLRTLKNMTADAYYASREGLFNELGYQGNTPHFMDSPGKEPAEACAVSARTGVFPVLDAASGHP